VTDDTRPWWQRWAWGAVAFIGGAGLSIAAWMLWSRRPPPPDTRARDSREDDRVREADDALQAADAELTDLSSIVDNDAATKALADLVNARSTEPGR